MSGRQNSKPLSYKAIEAMKPGDKDKADIGEYRGLRVSCGRTGKKSFYYRYNDPANPRKQKQITLGVFPILTLEQARIRLKELKLMRHQGLCPASELAKEQRDAALAADTVETKPFTVSDVIELYLGEYIEDHKSSTGELIRGARKPKGQAEARRTLCTDVLRDLGDRDAMSISAQDVSNLVLKIVARGANVQAGNVLRELGSAYDYAIGTGRLPDDFVNPTDNAKKKLKMTRVRLTSQKATRVFDDEELRQFLQWLPESAYPQVQKNILRLTLWTGCRTGELCGLYWEQVNLEKGTIHLKETKTDVERYVQLSTQAVSFLKTLKMTTADCLFPSRTTKAPIQQKALTTSAWILKQNGQMIDLPTWTPHDLRRTVRTGLARLSCPADIAEAILGHSQKGIQGTYNLHRYNDECKVWLQKWADHMDGLIK